MSHTGTAPDAAVRQDDLARRAQRLLDLPVRRRILALVEEEPGLPVGLLQARLGLGWGTLHHHLRRMQETGLVHAARAGRRRLVFPGPADAAADPSLAQGQALLAGRTARLVAQAVLAHPGLGVDALAARTGESTRAVYHHLRRLAAAGLVVSARAGRYAGLQAGPALARLLDDPPCGGEIDCETDARDGKRYVPERPGKGLEVVPRVSRPGPP